jgi:hypothetical protein
MGIVIVEIFDKILFVIFSLSSEKWIKALPKKKLEMKTFGIWVLEIIY